MLHKYFSVAVLVLSLLLSVQPLRAEDTLELDKTIIRANSELPKSLYIVPWKDSEHQVSAGKPMNSLIFKLIEPVERRAFEERLKLHLIKD